MNSMQYNRKFLRKIIKDLTDSEFDESLDDFPSVREQFTRGMDKTQKINIILEYFANKPIVFNQFLADIKNCNPIAYNKYYDSLLDESQKSSNQTSFLICIDEFKQILP